VRCRWNALSSSQVPTTPRCGSPTFRRPTSSRATQELLQDKSLFARYLAAAHIPHPRTYRLESPEDVAAVPFDTLGRVFIKPVNSQKFSDVVGVKGVWVDGKAAMADAWARFHAQGFAVMAQEYVPGPASEHFFVDGFRDAAGLYPGLFARRRVRMSPPDFGNSSCSESIPLGEVAEAVEHVRRLLGGLAYRGIFSAEFKRDPRDGEFRILEVNTRAWTYVEFAARRGINVCDMAWHDAQGLVVRHGTREYAAGKVCVDLYHDLACVRRTWHAERRCDAGAAWLAVDVSQTNGRTLCCDRTDRSATHGLARGECHAA
jgi:D-aspartate ligase